ncbi:prepilin-type N-terminal cleavage/methylation domain-containing protein [Desulfoprunum benzoelyticum]|uniref:Prepilin-type N-terminal cleavage/methylation domain-containing protein n=1 Tax=Desulfoprunum benzoelyticum TaxID=1506996 RepID=A0A840UVL2_9BACT|nr:prepilin-type N-terminal cleavage/methylation domain-containing protein [Desulfoprunum benzoelyticum]MBB5346758.1 prepilin-type N-terminal cleavage/methylation domain-containing protein [Desulfoprunum benzoelyticum]MBM9531547.1 prepilin-type N-terminal cleavage/methylation domain-containing protein [Desulfoprunum benzoelyticum]
MRFALKEQGFSLLEVIIALAIFSISIIALYAIQTRTITQNATASRITTGSTWASEKIEELISADYDTVASDNDESPDKVYKLDWTVTNEVPLPNTKTIKMVVTTPGRTGTGSKVELEYIKHKGI